ncbi:Mediator of RNA polymerase II transcription subunit 9 [Bienertia sinuspersici]
MMRTRLVWFTSGFVVNGAAIAYCLHRDLSKDHYLLVNQLKHNFGAMEARVSNLESVPHSSNAQEGGNSS